VDFDGYAMDAVVLVGTTPDGHHADDPLASVDELRAFLASRPCAGSAATCGPCSTQPPPTASPRWSSG
jgi:hypothetical protein